MLLQKQDLWWNLDVGLDEKRRERRGRREKEKFREINRGIQREKQKTQRENKNNQRERENSLYFINQD